MTARSPSAFMLSALFHGLVILLILLLAYVANDQRKESPRILELVAGAGNNYGATVAAALGSPDGIKVNIPTPPAPAPAPAPVEPPAPAPVAEQSPVAPAPITTAPAPVVQKTPPVKKPPAPAAAATATGDKAPNFANDVKRIASKRAARLETQYRKQLAADAERRAKAEAAAAKVKHIETAGIREGLAGGSDENKTGGANGKVMSREESDLNDSYFALLKAHLKENHEKPPGLSDTLVATVGFFVAADGSISRARIVKSSRSSEFDRSVLDAIRKTEAIGPRPDHKSEEVTLDFKMRDEDAN